jgi:hypothetical protein
MADEVVNPVNFDIFEIDFIPSSSFEKLWLIREEEWWPSYF